MASVHARRAAEALVQLVPVRGFELLVGGVRAVQGPDGFGVAEALAGPLRDSLANALDGYVHRIEGLRSALARIVHGRTEGLSAQEVADTALAADERARAAAAERRVFATRARMPGPASGGDVGDGAPPPSGLQVVLQRYCGAERGGLPDRGAEPQWTAFLAGQRTREAEAACTPPPGPEGEQLAWITGWKLVDERFASAAGARRLQRVMRDGLASISDDELLAEVKRRGLEAGADAHETFPGILAGKADLAGVGFRGHGPGGGI